MNILFEAAVVLLSREGKLSLDDPIRKYLPELPATPYGPVTIRQMLNHTSGIRDWGTLSSLSGWRRGTRQLGNDFVLDLLSKQRELNFPAGTEWSYSNSNYNLAAIIVERVSGKPFAGFVRDRIFAPAGMTHSSVREDWTRVVKNRATAYDPVKDGFDADISIENITGNCCVNTTAGDLLRWSAQAPKFPELEVVSKLPNGNSTGYGLGLQVAKTHGTAEIYHSGATAGWRAFLTRFPEKNLSISLLCNRGDAPTGSIIRQVADLFLPTDAEEEKKAFDLANAGLYRNPKKNAVMRFFVKDGALRMGFGGNGSAIDAGAIHFENGHVRLTNFSGLEATYDRVDEWKPAPEELKKLTGAYRSDEIGVTYEVRLKDGALAAHLDPKTDIALEPTFANAFHAGAGTLVTFTGDGFDVKSDFGMGSGTARLERLHFTRVK